jgi:ATPase complex subunit ATP10
LKENRERAQVVWLNLEDNAAKSFVIRIFAHFQRRRIGEENWKKYFIVRNEISMNLREQIGLLNSRVGYTYLVDPECRIRWAGCGPSQEEERQSLTKGLYRILDEMDEAKTARASSRPARTRSRVSI